MQILFDKGGTGPADLVWYFPLAVDCGEMATGKEMGLVAGSGEGGPVTAGSAVIGGKEMGSVATAGSTAVGGKEMGSVATPLLEAKEGGSVAGSGERGLVTEARRWAW